MVTLMLLCATLLGVTLYSLYQHAPQPQEAFMLQQSNTSTTVEADAFSCLLDGHRLTDGDLAQIQALPLVSKLKTATSVRVNLLLPRAFPIICKRPAFPSTMKTAKSAYTASMLPSRTPATSCWTRG